VAGEGATENGTATGEEPAGAVRPNVYRQLLASIDRPEDLTFIFDGLVGSVAGHG
jgi:hypothetical protein